MKIFIDHQFTNIYNGEFANWIKNNIISVLQSNNDVYVSKSQEDTQNTLSFTEFDFVIITGYDSITLASINQKFKNTKTISIIYDLNAEKMVELFPNNERLQDIIAFKSRLVFLCNHIVTLNDLTKNEIIGLYSGYENFGLAIKNKVTTVKNDFHFVTDYSARLIKDKYIVIQDSINGLSMLVDDYIYILNSVKNQLEDFPDIKIVVLADNVHQSINYELANNNMKHLFMFLKDVSDKELVNLYKNSICTIFPSSFDTNIDRILLAYSLNTISIINPKNDIYLAAFEKEGIFYDETINLIDIVRTIMRSNKQTKDNLRESQNRGLLNYINKSDSTIQNILNKMIKQ